MKGLVIAAALLVSFGAQAQTLQIKGLYIGKPISQACSASDPPNGQVCYVQLGSLGGITARADRLHVAQLDFIEDKLANVIVPVGALTNAEKDGLLEALTRAFGPPAVARRGTSLEGVRWSDGLDSVVLREWPKQRGEERRFVMLLLQGKRERAILGAQQRAWQIERGWRARDDVRD